MMKSWIKAFRLRTLPLALSSTVIGSLLAAADGHFRWPVVIAVLFTTLFLQILSNLANDYGDAIKGTDNQHRVGPNRSVQSGEISKEAMKNAVLLFAVFSLISGVLLLYFSLGNHWGVALLFFVLGVSAILAAVKYTVGTQAYGYHRLGDVFVFLFFGLIGVVGTYYLNTLTFSFDIILPAVSIGFFSVGVLNLNNMRDLENDVSSGKSTIASYLGYHHARRYHFMLITTGWFTAIVYLLLHYHSLVNLAFLLTLPLFVKDLMALFQTKNNALLDPFLKKLAMATFLFSIFFGLSFVI